MKIFVGYGYNDRDEWIPRDVFPILNAMGLSVEHGKGLYAGDGTTVPQAVKDLIDQSDALVGFSTSRKGQKNADFGSHIWVRDELQYAISTRKRAVEVREKGVNVPNGLFGDVQTIHLDMADKLSCVAAVAAAVGSWNMRRIRLVPKQLKDERPVHQALSRSLLTVKYRTRIGGRDSRYQEGRVERIDKGLYMDAIGLPDGSLVEIVGSMQNGGVLFNTGWAPADVVEVEY